MHQIHVDHNTRLETWIYLDWARAYLMLHEAEEGVKMFREFFQRADTLRSDHAIQRAYLYLKDLKEAGYSDVQTVRDFREELRQEDQP